MKKIAYNKINMKGKKTVLGGVETLFPTMFSKAFF